jgi:hypothetical protein
VSAAPVSGRESAQDCYAIRNDHRSKYQVVAFGPALAPLRPRCLKLLVKAWFSADEEGYARRVVVTSAVSRRAISWISSGALSDKAPESQAEAR